MKIDINANSLKKLVRVLRQLAGQLEDLYTDEKDKASVHKLKVVPEDTTSVQEIVEYYKSIHPSRGRSLNPKHKDWALVRRRIKDGYSVEELKAAILNNSTMSWWKQHNRHGIEDIMKKDSNLDKFVQSSKESGNAKVGYTPGSSSFSNNDCEDFAD